MNSLYNTIEEGNIGIFESPTVNSKIKKGNSIFKNKEGKNINNNLFNLKLVRKV
jgi:hypothetical protein